MKVIVYSIVQKLERKFTEKEIQESKRMNLASAARYVGVHRDTLKRWLIRDGVPRVDIPNKFKVRKCFIEVYKELLEAC